MFIDYYSILEIESTATLERIKKAFKEQAKLWHPDRNSTSEANERMQLINEAYLILSDKDAKILYDLEYKRYCNNLQSIEDFRKFVDESYEIFDPTLNHWMGNAKKQAKEIVDELKKSGKRAGNAFLERAILGLFRYIVLGGIFLVILKTCQK